MGDTNEKCNMLLNVLKKNINPSDSSLKFLDDDNEYLKINLGENPFIFTKFIKDLYSNCLDGQNNMDLESLILLKSSGDSDFSLTSSENTIIKEKKNITLDGDENIINILYKELQTVKSQLL